MSVTQTTPQANYGKIPFLGLLFALSWLATLVVALVVDHEHLGALALAGSFGGAVAPWCAGAAVTLVSGRPGRPVAVIVCLLAVGAIWWAQRA
jgi:hypothetical protein